MIPRSIAIFLGFAVLCSFPAGLVQAANKPSSRVLKECIWPFDEIGRVQNRVYKLYFREDWTPKGNRTARVTEIEDDTVRIEDGRTGRDKVFMRSDSTKLGPEFFDPRFFKFDHSTNPKILDAGAAPGQRVEKLRKAGYEAYGIDMHFEPLDLQKPFLVRGDSMNTGLVENQFDVVLSSFEQFYHYHSDAKMQAYALQELGRIIKPGGEIRIEPCNLEMIKKALNMTNERGEQINPSLEIVYSKEKLPDHPDFADAIAVIRKKE